MSVELDHILWAAPDLDQGSAVIEALTGVAPARGGSHPGFGTRNSLISLGDTYLEIIAPDPSQPLDGNRGGTIAALPKPGLMTFAVRTTDIGAYGDAAGRAGIATRGPVEMGRTRPDGVRLDWACLYITDPEYGEAIPFAIDWKGSPHPSASAPSGCRLTRFTVLHPKAAALSQVFATMSVPAEVKGAATAGFLATIATPRGEIVLTA
jgi:hypothetical protein